MYQKNIKQDKTIFIQQQKKYDKTIKSLTFIFFSMTRYSIINYNK